jgi:hypothetical protein
MALLGDIQLYDTPSVPYPGDDVYRVDSGTTSSITAGTPVAFTLGSAFVAAATTNKPIVATDFLGIATSTSTETASATGTVNVMKFVSGTTYLIAPKVAATFDTQSEYNALVGDRVLLDLTASTWTILAADSATYGCVIMPLDVTKNPGMVRFAFRNGVNYLT